MRAFIALDIPPVLREDVAALARQLKTSVRGRFVPRENYHVTLAFLGDATERELADTMGVLDEAASRFDPVDLAPDGLGKFGRRARCDPVARLHAGPDAHEPCRLRTRGT